MKYNPSDRETNILALIAEGFTDKEIASELNISDKTVKTHRQNLIKKFKVRNSCHLVCAAFKSSIIK